MTDNAQIRAIHTLRRQVADFSDADYRAHLKDVYGVSSCTQLTFMQAAGLIDTLRRMAPKQEFRRGSATRVEGQYGRALQALWIAAYNLGVVDKRDDRALLAFVERQTGLSHTRFLKDPADATKAIEGLKAWIAREGGVAWPKNRSPLARKLAIVAAQETIMRRKLPTFSAAAFGNLKGYGASFDRYDEGTLDRLSASIGGMIRRAREETKRRKAA